MNAKSFENSRSSVSQHYDYEDCPLYKDEICPGERCSQFKVCDIPFSMPSVANPLPPAHIEQELPLEFNINIKVDSHYG